VPLQGFYTEAQSLHWPIWW